MNLKDTISFRDDSSVGGSGLYARTRVIAGYSDNTFIDKNGVTRFNEVIFDKHNMIELGGALFTLEKVFGIKAGLKVDFLENFVTGIKTSTEQPINEFYPKDTKVCLFGVGIGGCGEAITDVKDVKFFEREIKDMIPMRQTADPLTGGDEQKYWFKKNVTVGGSTQKVAYYLKTFENTPEIKALWRDAEEGVDGSEVNENVHQTPSSNNTPIETFVEIVMKISAKDVREYFVDSGNVEQTRINSIGLFTGIKHKVSESPEAYDYRQVKLFSKLNFNNEMLVLPKDITVVYRIYTS